MILGWMFGPGARELLPDWKSVTTASIAIQLLIGFFAAVPVMIAVELMWKIPWEPIKELERLGETGPLQSLLSLTSIELILISVCAGLGEELFFRGWLLPFLAGGNPLSEHSIAMVVVAVVVSSVLFGFLHWISKLYVVLASLMGLYFAGLMLVTGSLLVPITTHAVYDAMQLLWASHKCERSQSAMRMNQRATRAF